MAEDGQDVSQSLAGHTAILTLLPLSVRELARCGAAGSLPS
jgi:hypothetical protein